METTVTSFGKNNSASLLILFFDSKSVYLHQYDVKNVITFIHNCPLQPFVRITAWVYHTIYVVCVTFYTWETFLGNFYLFSDFQPQVYQEKVAERDIFSIYFCSRCLAWELNLGICFCRSRRHYYINIGKNLLHTIFFFFYRYHISFRSLQFMVNCS